MLRPRRADEDDQNEEKMANLVHLDIDIARMGLQHTGSCRHVCDISNMWSVTQTWQAGSRSTCVVVASHGPGSVLNSHNGMPLCAASIPVTLELFCRVVWTAWRRNETTALARSMGCGSVLVTRGHETKSGPSMSRATGASWSLEVKKVTHSSTANVAPEG